MRSLIKTCFIIPVLFVFSCGGFRHTDNYKVVLDVSFRTYIESLTNGAITLSDVYKNGIPASASDEQIIDGFIDGYAHLKSDKWLLDVFSGNPMLPKFDNTIELKHFIISDYNTKMSRMREVILNRINNFTHIPKDKIKIEQTKNQIIVFIPGVEDKSEIEAAFKNRNGVNCWEVATLSEIMEYATKLNDTLSRPMPEKEIRPVDTGKELSLAETIAQGEDQGKIANHGLFELLAPTIDANGRDYGAAYWAIASAEDTAKINSIFASAVYKAIFPGYIKMLWGTMPGKQDSSKKILALFAIKKGYNKLPLVDGDDIKSAKLESVRGSVKIMIEMNAKGTVKWARATRQCVGKPIAMELDNYVLSAPNVMNEITGGHSVISGVFTAKEGDDLARAISSGKFPLDFKITSIEKYNTQK